MNITWFVIRGSGIVAYVMLAMATVWGLLSSTKILGRAVKAKGVNWFHESLGIAALLATGVHMVALTLDEFIEFGVRELFLPGAATYRPLAVAFGIMAFYGVFLVAVSFYVKGLIGQRAWRAIHYTSFGTFVAVTVHGIMAGTDTPNPYAFAMYLGFSVVVAVLLVVRVAQSMGPEEPQRLSARTAERTVRARRPEPAPSPDPVPS